MPVTHEGVLVGTIAGRKVSYVFESDVFEQLCDQPVINNDFPPLKRKISILTNVMVKMVKKLNVKIMSAKLQGQGFEQAAFDQVDVEEAAMQVAAVEQTEEQPAAVEQGAKYHLVGMNSVLVYKFLLIWK